jgi:hypothetical protein
MRSSRFILLLVLVTLAKSTTAQQTTVSSPQAAALLQQSLAALSGGHPLTDVTLSGTARSIAGSDDESGTVVVKALAGTGTRLDLTLPSGSRSEIRNTSSVPVVGSWSGPDGVSHLVADQNLVTDPGWSPVFLLAAFATSQNALFTYVGTETKNGNAVVHITASLQFPGLTSTGAAFMRHFSQAEIYLNPTTFLPVAIAYNLHPDVNSSVDIPIEIDYSAYQVINGTQMPFHVQKFVNNCLALDFQFDSALLNSGLSATTFTVGAGL